ncbi:MAG: NAD-dependent epimerase/dehydratase family protein [Kofleriaceae bacterium]|nr:NAD-dependent epimerase/dehydratase family protein [Kofleriaceae bacterium]MBP6839620.1 NAD-dependent epimerase/dehydratase family protein [Kofleriaceae bacterium]MBP9207729.1 NAD-dependent epimerase/dehydratase family protein [Kofleriaceae bacterium]
MGSRVDQPGRRVVAVTGACTYLGTELIRHLEEDRAVERVLALDVRPPTVTDPATTKVEFVKLDLTQPTVDGELATLLGDARVDTFVHGAFLSHPTHASEWAHELEDVGTMHVLNACAGAPPRRVVLVSTTMVYGAHPGNPNYLTEDAELRGHRDSRFVNDKVRAEKQVARFAHDHPQVETCALRFAPVLGPTVDNLFTRFFRRPAAPVMLGHDPLLQFIHEQDAAWALHRAVGSSARGAFNIVGKGVLPYTTVLAMLGRVPVPMPYLVARGLSRALWATQIVGSPPSFLDFLLYLCVADGGRASRELGFTARLGLKRTLGDFLGVSPEDGATDVTRVYA